MGSEKYKGENTFDSFLSKHGGSSNASTDYEKVLVLVDDMNLIFFLQKKLYAFLHVTFLGFYQFSSFSFLTDCFPLFNYATILQESSGHVGISYV